MKLLYKACLYPTECKLGTLPKGFVEEIISCPSASCEFLFAPK